MIGAFLRVLFSSNLRALAYQYGWAIVRQLVQAGFDYVEDTHDNPQWTPDERRANLASHLKSLDMVPGTKIDNDLVAAIVDHFLGPKNQK